MPWQRVIALFLIFAVLGALFALRARAGKDLGTLSRVLRYPRAFRIVGWVCVVGLGLLTLLATGTGNQGRAVISQERSRGAQVEDAGVSLVRYSARLASGAEG
jgi:hypothetical protein